MEHQCCCKLWVIVKFAMTFSMPLWPALIVLNAYCVTCQCHCQIHPICPAGVLVFVPSPNLPLTPKSLHLCHFSPEIRRGKVHFCPESNL